MPKRIFHPVDAALEVLAAWTQPGKSPTYHADMKKRLRREWPALANALDVYEAACGSRVYGKRNGEAHRNPEIRRAIEEELGRINETA